MPSNNVMICDAGNSSRRRRGRKGAAMLESALVLLTLLGMIVFVLDMGRILLIEQFVTARAEAAIRGAIVNNWSSDQVKNYLVYGSTTSPGGSAIGFPGLKTSNVSYTTLGTMGTADYRLQIKVTGISLFTWIPGIAGTYTAQPVVVTMPAQSLGATS